MSMESHSSSAPSISSPAKSERRALAVVLAAGEGKRMLSRTPKVLHQIANRAVVSHVLNAVKEAQVGRIAVVVGPSRDDVAAEARQISPQASIHIQAERFGTAHAVLAARSAFNADIDDVIIVFGDTPLIKSQTFYRLRQALADGASVAVLGFEAKDPTGYGRLLLQGEELVAIREHKDATEAERAIRLCNGGVMAIAGQHAISLLDKIDNNNAKGEYYLTDIVEHAKAAGLRAVALIADEEELLGINDRMQLAEAEAVIQKRLRHAAMKNGVTLISPDTVFLSYDTTLGRDVVVEPHVVFGPGVSVEEGAIIRAFSHLTGTVVRARAEVGPFARLRPEADIGSGAHVGNFVEIKNTKLGEGVKVGHLSYLGDADVGAGSNIGAGTITCNYDGVSKHRTSIGKNAFIGSNSSLVAPLRVGDDAYTGSGSVVTQNVPDNALALSRAPQVVKEGWAARFRALRAASQERKS